MKDAPRFLALALLLLGGLGLVTALVVRRTGTPLPSSLAPAYQLMGKPVKSINHLVTKVMPIDDIDERDFGEVYRARYAAQVRPDDPDLLYLADLMSHLAGMARKPFPYSAYPIDGDEPNAMALPGGVILVTRGLLTTLGSEAELVSVLGHEMGHVEQGHCLDAVKFEVLAAKLGARPFGEIADFGVRVLAAHSFSKTQEDEADQFGYDLLVESPYDHRGSGQAFLSLLEFERRQERDVKRGADPIRDYFASHPPLEIREATFRERADAWWRSHPDAIRRVGQQHLRDRVSSWRRVDSDDSTRVELPGPNP